MSSLRGCFRAPSSVLLAVFFTSLAAPAFSSTTSYTGSFVNDNDAVPITFSLFGPSTVTFQTFSYGGGINGLGNVIPAGGFEPYLQLFNAVNGSAIGDPIPAGTGIPNCGPRNPDPARNNFCLDLYGVMSLNAGDFILTLTQSPNAPVDQNLNDGFQFDSDPNFANGFVGTFGFQGTPNWAVDITIAAAPEPAPALFIAGSLLILGLCARVARSARSRV